ncbi:L-asparaginase II [Kribbella flavida DSM 17836]|uniref:L-asparaginase II n=1 Tax=Kribbella flavida (strain DSM 17836 / JCM 10339 / NBRC 14399) TaxID=479435 RepID=D2PUR9_KRIFD|nr:asparaginase [Kribbella flavida]ADB31385.1 L-asparaginase II [Kribbella flavida DSM 17836]
MSKGVPGLDGVVELAAVVRSGFVESRHFGMAVVLDPEGRQLYAAGDAEAVILPRSTAKPLQAVGCLVAGATLDERATAIAAGSHTGEDQHVALVDRMLSSAGLDRSALRCPPDRPEDEPTRFRLIAEGIGPEAVRMNCSGKHAAMLLAAVAGHSAGADADPAAGYLEPSAPVQRVIQAEIERLTAATIDVVTVDGCGAPLLGMPLSGLALAFGRLATASPGSPEHQVAAAMRAYPQLVGGRGHLNTDTMRLLPGVLAKGGAEGVIAMAAPDGHAVAVKVIDGNPRATTALALTLLAKCGVDVTPAAELRHVQVLGGGRSVGRIVPAI